MNLFGLGTAELILIVVVILLFFGKDKLPELARSIGKSVRELREGLDKTTTDSAPTKRSEETKNDNTKIT